MTAPPRSDATLQAYDSQRRRDTSGYAATPRQPLRCHEALSAAARQMSDAAGHCAFSRCRHAAVSCASYSQ